MRKIIDNNVLYPVEKPVVETPAPVPPVVTPSQEPKDETAGTPS